MKQYNTYNMSESTALTILSDEYHNADGGEEGMQPVYAHAINALETLSEVRKACSIAINEYGDYTEARNALALITRVLGETIGLCVDCEEPITNELHKCK